MYVCYSNSMFLMLYCLSKALRSLQNVSGIYGMVVPSAAVAFPGQIVGSFVGGETLRALLPTKPDNNGRKESTIFREESIYEDVLHRTTKESWNETEWRSNSELKVTVEEHSKRQR
jgi:hypothetical protein